MKKAGPPDILTTRNPPRNRNISSQEAIGELARSIDHQHLCALRPIGHRTIGYQLEPLYDPFRSDSFPAGLRIACLRCGRYVDYRREE